MNLVNTTRQEEACPGFAIEHHVEVTMVVEEGIVFFLHNKVEEVDETVVEGQLSRAQMRQIAMSLWQEHMVKYIRASLASDTIS